MRQLLNLPWALAAALACTQIAWGAALQVDDFSSSIEGWSGFSPTRQTTGGPSGDGDAFLQVAAEGGFGSGSHLATYNQSADWVGDYTAIGAASVTVDLMNETNSESLEMRLVVFGPLSTNNRWTSSIAQTVPSDGMWRSYEFSLAEADLTRVLGVSNYADAISDVRRIMLRHDPVTPSSEGASVDATLGIDNIRLVAAPEKLPADFDGDGQVGASDLRRWELAFGVNAMADADRDGDSDGADFMLFEREYGAGSSPAVAAVVPEPATWGLAACALLMLARARQGPVHRR